MLTLKRKSGQGLVFTVKGEKFEVKILSASNGSVRVGVVAEKCVHVLRSELSTTGIEEKK